MPIITFLDHTIPVAADFNDSYSFVNTEVRTFERGGTGLSSYTKGDLIYASATNTVAELLVGVYGALLAVQSTGLPGYSRVLYKSGTDQATSGAVSFKDAFAGTLTLKGGTLSTANRVRMAAQAVVTNNTGGNVTFSWILRYGTDTQVDVVVATGVTDRLFNVEASLCGDDSTNAELFYVLVRHAGTTVAQAMGTNNANSATDRALQLILQKGDATANSALTIKYAMAEVVV